MKIKIVSTEVFLSFSSKVHIKDYSGICTTLLIDDNYYSAIWINPNLTGQQRKATIRHEITHALRYKRKNRFLIFARNSNSKFLKAFSSFQEEIIAKFYAGEITNFKSFFYSLKYSYSQFKDVLKETGLKNSFSESAAALAGNIFKDLFNIDKKPLLLAEKN